MGGGKIGDTDVIDENSLLNAQNNNELGKNVEKLDLEQVRYFNSGKYDLPRLLLIHDKYPYSRKIVENGTFEKQYMIK